MGAGHGSTTFPAEEPAKSSDYVGAVRITAVIFALWRHPAILEA